MKKFSLSDKDQAQFNQHQPQTVQQSDFQSVNLEEQADTSNENNHTEVLRTETDNDQSAFEQEQ